MPGNSKGTFRSSSQAATCLPVYHTRRRLHIILLITERQAGQLWIAIFIVFGLTRPGIEPESTVSVADALSTQPLIGFKNVSVTLVYSTHLPIQTFSLFNFWFKPSSSSKIPLKRQTLATASDLPFCDFFVTQKIPPRKFPMTSLHATCGLCPAPNPKSWLRLCLRLFWNSFLLAAFMVNESSQVTRI